MLIERTLPGLHAALAEELRDLHRDAPILDLGCGTGAWIERLRSLGFSDLTGVDADAPSGFIRADLESGDISFGKHFRLITAIEIIEHLGNPARIFEIAARCLSPDGVLLITTPNIHSVRARIKFLLRSEMPQFDKWGDPTHVAPVYFPGIQRVASRSGLSILRAWTYPERKTLMFRAPVRAMAAVARLVLADPLRGDILCMLFTNRS